MEFIASSTWRGAKEGYYFGTTSEQGTGYYLDVRGTLTKPLHVSTSGSKETHQGKEQNEDIYRSDNGKKRKRNIIIDESQNKIQSIPSRHHEPRLTPEELLEQAEQQLRQGGYNKSNKIIELSEKGVQSAVALLDKLHQTNAMQRAQHASSSDTEDPTKVDPQVYLESELALHDQLQAFSGVATHPQFFPLLDLQLCTELLSHPNSDIAVALIHVWVEWLDVESITAENEEEYANARKSVTEFAHRIFSHESSTLVELMVANLGRLNSHDNNDDDDHDSQGMEDILTCIEHLVELLDSNSENQNQTSKRTVVEFLARETTLLSWLVAQLPRHHARSAEILVALVPQPALHLHVSDWTTLPVYTSILVDDSDNQGGKSTTTVDGLEIMLQTLAPFRKQQPGTSNELDLIENVVLVLASLLVFDSSSTDNTKNFRNGKFLAQFLQAQGPELIARSLKEKVHLGGIGLSLLDLRDKNACEYLVGTVGILKFLFPLWMGHSIPKPAPDSSVSLTKKAKRIWLHKLEGNVIHIMYNLTMYLDDHSPEDAKQRLLVQFLDHDRLDRLVELLLQYDEAARKAEYKFYRHVAEDDQDEETLAAEALAARLAGGGDLFHRLGAICAFVCVHSKKSHAHLLEQLTLQKSGIGLVKEALQEFISILEEGGHQKKQLESNLHEL